MKTFIKYPGGKAKELSIIQANKPSVIHRYFEPFVGGGSVFFDLGIADSHINDISTDLFLLYSYIKEKNPLFLQRLSALNETWKNLPLFGEYSVDFSFISTDCCLPELFEHNRKVEEIRRTITANRFFTESSVIIDTSLITYTASKAAFYYTIRHIYNQERHSKSPDHMSKALAYYFLREYCYSSMFRFSAAGDFNVPYGGASYNDKNFDAKIDLIQQYNLSNTQIYNEDYTEFLNRFSFKSTDFIFVDPPYDSEFNEYDGNSFDRTAQIQLADMLSTLPASVMVVIKNTDFIYNLYNEKGFTIKSFDKKYSVNFQNRNVRDVKHLLITNY